MRCYLHTQLLQILNLVRLLVCDAKRVEFLLFATLQQTKGTRTVRYVDNKAYRIQRDELDVLVRLGSAGRLGRVKASRASLAQLNGIGEQVKQQTVATSTQRIGQLVHLALRYEASIGANQVCGAAVNIVEYIKDCHAGLRAPLVLVNVQSHLLDGLQCILETCMIRIAVARVLEDVVQEQAYAGQTLYGSDHQILQALAATLRLCLIDLEKGMETWIFAITVLQLFLHLLIEVDIGWIGLDELVSMLDDNVPNQAILTPIGMQLPQMLQHALMHLVYRQEVAKYRLDLRLIQQWIVRLCKLLQFVFEQLMREEKEIC